MQSCGKMAVLRDRNLCQARRKPGYCLRKAKIIETLTKNSLAPTVRHYTEKSSIFLLQSNSIANTYLVYTSTKTFYK
jgi:hypothetical protein